jgi:lantibiotic modifying enzyme
MHNLPDKKNIFSIILEIEKGLSQWETSDPGLYTGAMGVPLFYRELFQLTADERHVKKLHDKLNLIFKNMDVHPTQHANFCRGWSGIGWALSRLNTGKIVTLKKSFFEPIDSFVYENSLLDFKKGHYDLLHGGLGGVLYAIERINTSGAKKFLKEAIELLDQTKQKLDEGIGWYEYRKLHTDDQRELNLGLSHGIPGIINVLTRLFQAGFHEKKIVSLVDGAVSWMVNQKLEDHSVSLYPAVGGQNEMSQNPSRLAWCYGDMGIALTLLQAGNVFRRKAWIEAANTIIEHLSQRSVILYEAHLDACFCHGTAGFAHLYNYFYRETGNLACKSKSDFWIEQTCSQMLHSDGNGQFSFFNINSLGKSKTEFSLLEGSIGVGLVLIAHLAGKRNEWDSAFLL